MTDGIQRGRWLGVISVMNYKGGVGKTTVTANLAGELALRGQNVLIIDLDPQANLTLSFLSLQDWKSLDEEAKTIKHWYDQYLKHNVNGSLQGLIVNPSRVNSQLEARGSTGRVDLISSHLDLINVDMELSSKLGGITVPIIHNNYFNVLTRLRKKLEGFKDRYDVILIDCPPNFNLVTQNAIVASDYYIVPAKPDYLSTLGIWTLRRHVDQLKEMFNTKLRDLPEIHEEPISPKMLGVVFTMVGFYNQQPISAQRDFIKQIERQFPVFKSYVRDHRTLFADAPQKGIPVVLLEDRGAESIQNEIKKLANEVLSTVE